MAGPKIGGLGSLGIGISTIAAGSAFGPAGAAVGAVVFAVSQILNLFPNRQVADEQLRQFQANPSPQLAASMLETLYSQRERVRAGGPFQMFFLPAIENAILELEGYLDAAAQPAAPPQYPTTYQIALDSAAQTAAPAIAPAIGPAQLPVSSNPQLPAQPVWQPFFLPPPPPPQTAVVIPAGIPGGAPMTFNVPEQQSNFSWPSLIGNIWSEVSPMINKPRPLPPQPAQDPVIDYLSAVPWWVYLVAGIAVYSLVKDDGRRRR